MYYVEFIGNIIVIKYLWLLLQICDLILRDFLGNSVIDFVVFVQNYEMWVVLYNYFGKLVVEKQRRLLLNNLCSLCVNFNLESEIDFCCFF